MPSELQCVLVLASGFRYHLAHVVDLVVLRLVARQSYLENESNSRPHLPNLDPVFVVYESAIPLVRFVDAGTTVEKLEAGYFLVQQFMVVTQELTNLVFSC